MAHERLNDVVGAARSPPWGFLVLLFETLPLSAAGWAKAPKETQQWQSCQKKAQRAKTPPERTRVYEEFLREHPASWYAGEAKARIAAIQREVRRQAAARENFAAIEWADARTANTPSAYQRILAEFTGTAAAVEARAKLDELAAPVLQEARRPGDPSRDGAPVWVTITGP